MNVLQWPVKGTMDDSSSSGATSSSGGATSSSGGATSSSDHWWSSNKVTPGDLCQYAESWSLAADAATATLLQSISQRLVSRTHEVEGALKRVLEESDRVFTTISNTNNAFHMLANTQFIENRTYQDEDVVVAAETTPSVPESAGSEDDVIERCRQAITDGLELVGRCYELHEIQDSDSDDEDDSPASTVAVYTVMDPYESKALPFIIGSSAFMADDKVGLHDVSSSEENSKNTLSPDETASEDEVEGDDEGSLKSKPIPAWSSKMMDEESDSDWSEEEEATRPIASVLPAVNRKPRLLLSDDDDHDQDFFTTTTTAKLTARQTDCQPDRLSDRQTDSQTEKPSARQTDSQREDLTARHTPCTCCQTTCVGSTCAISTTCSPAATSSLILTSVLQSSVASSSLVPGSAPSSGGQHDMLDHPSFVAVTAVVLLLSWLVVTWLQQQKQTVTADDDSNKTGLCSEEDEDDLFRGGPQHLPAHHHPPPPPLLLPSNNTTKERSKLSAGVENVRARPEPGRPTRPAVSRPQRNGISLFVSDDDDDDDLFSSKLTSTGKSKLPSSGAKRRFDEASASADISSDDETAPPQPSARKVPAGGVNVFGTAVTSAIRRAPSSDSEASDGGWSPERSSAGSLSSAGKSKSRAAPGPVAKVADTGKLSGGGGLFDDDDDEDDLFGSIATKSHAGHATVVSQTNRNSDMTSAVTKSFGNESGAGTTNTAKSDRLFSDDDDPFGTPVYDKHVVPAPALPASKLPNTTSSTSKTLDEGSYKSSPIVISSAPKTTSDSLFGSLSDDDLFAPSGTIMAANSSVFASEPPPLPPQDTTSSNDKSAPLTLGSTNDRSAPLTSAKAPKPLPSTLFGSSSDDDDLFSPMSKPVHAGPRVVQKSRGQEGFPQAKEDQRTNLESPLPEDRIPHGINSQKLDTNRGILGTSTENLGKLDTNAGILGTSTENLEKLNTDRGILGSSTEDLFNTSSRTAGDLPVPSNSQTLMERPGLSASLDDDDIFSGISPLPTASQVIGSDGQSTNIFVLDDEDDIFAIDVPGEQSAVSAESNIFQTSKINIFQDMKDDEDIFKDTKKEGSIFVDTKKEGSIFEDTKKGGSIFEDTKKEDSIFVDTKKEGSIFEDTKKEDSIFEDTKKEDSIFEDTKKEDSIFEDTKKEDSIFEDTKKEDSIFEDTKKEDSIFEDTKKEDSIFEDTKKEDSIFEDTKKEDSIFEDTKKEDSIYEAQRRKTNKQTQQKDLAPTTDTTTDEPRETKETSSVINRDASFSTLPVDSEASVAPPASGKVSPVGEKPAKPVTKPTVLDTTEVSPVGEKPAKPATKPTVLGTTEVSPVGEKPAKPATKPTVLGTTEVSPVGEKPAKPATKPTVLGTTEVSPVGEKPAKPATKPTVLDTTEVSPVGEKPAKPTTKPTVLGTTEVSPVERETTQNQLQNPQYYGTQLRFLLRERNQQNQLQNPQEPAKQVKKTLGGVSLFGGADLFTHLNQSKSFLSTEGDGGEGSEAEARGRSGRADIGNGKNDNLFSSSPLPLSTEARGSVKVVEDETNRESDARSSAHTSTQDKAGGQLGREIGVSSEQGQQTKPRKKPPVGGVSMFSSGSSGLGGGGGELFSRVQQRKSMLAPESDSSDNSDGSPPKDVPQALPTRQMTAAVSSHPNIAPTSPLSPLSPVFTPGLIYPKTGGRESGVSFDEPATTTTTLQSLNKGRTRGVQKRRPPSRAHRRSGLVQSDDFDVLATSPVRDPASPVVAPDFLHERPPEANILKGLPVNSSNSSTEKITGANSIFTDTDIPDALSNGTLVEARNIVATTDRVPPTMQADVANDIFHISSIVEAKNSTSNTERAPSTKVTDGKNTVTSKESDNKDDDDLFGRTRGASSASGKIVSKGTRGSLFWGDESDDDDLFGEARRQPTSSKVAASQSTGKLGSAKPPNKPLSTHTFDDDRGKFHQ
nr:WASH complex subunit 2-like [Cherax quadricarinatus]